MTLGIIPVSHAQMMGGMGYTPGTGFGGATDPGAIEITEGYRLVPSVMVGERYDSNIFFVPKTAGIDREDFVTTAAPTIRGLYAGRSLSANVYASAVGEYYAKNPNLSYVGTNLGANVDISRLLDGLRPSSTWQVTEYYSFTPIPPAFSTGDVYGSSNPYLRGYQTVRTNTQINSTGTNLSVPLTQIFSVTGSYSYSFAKYGATASAIQSPGALLSSTTQSYTAGLATKLSGADTLTLNYAGSFSDYGSSGSFSANGATVRWQHLFSERAFMTANGGVQLVQTAFPSAPNTSTYAPTGGLSGSFKDRTTTLLISWFLGVTPAVQFQPQPLINNTLSLALTQLTPIQNLIGVLGLNYSRADELGSSASVPVSYYSYGANAGLTYRATTKTFFGLTVNYQNFHNDFGGTNYTIPRTAVQLTLTQALY